MPCSLYALKFNPKTTHPTHDVVARRCTRYFLQPLPLPDNRILCVRFVRKCQRQRAPHLSVCLNVEPGTSTMQLTHTREPGAFNWNPTNCVICKFVTTLTLARRARALTQMKTIYSIQLKCFIPPFHLHANTIQLISTAEYIIHTSPVIYLFMLLVSCRRRCVDLFVSMFGQRRAHGYAWGANVGCVLSARLQACE